ncbi:MAG: hypothetical protein MAG458_01723 [Nitrosopumilus sp.]|nr:hypothetical protein [Nitrosopumilus sp.]
MDKAAFANPNGKFVINSDGHETFFPKKLPPEIKFDPVTITLATEAHTKLGELSGIGELIPNPDLLIRPYVQREAVLSSKIEGTQASIMDIFQYEAKGKKESTEDGEHKRIQEVLNYIDALNDCLVKVQTKEINLEMIKNAHKILMENVRGQERTPGEFRKVQNWIGKEGSDIEDAEYVPPSSENLEENLLDLENFLQNVPIGIPVLIQCALIHYQFESIHPFADGNGRIGRLLIPLILAERKLLNRPLLYLSVYFERNRTEYYAHLLSVSQNGTWSDWIRFFLRGVIKQATDAINNIRKLTDLQLTYENKLKENRASGNTIQLMSYLFASPVITIPGVKDYLGVRYPTAKLAVNNLQEMGIIEEIGSRDRNKMFKAGKILEILT